MPRATRPFAFGGQNILTGRNVAYALAKGWKTAIEPVRGGMLDEWLRRSLGNEEAIEAVNAAKEPIAGSVETDDRMLARIVCFKIPEADTFQKHQPVGCVMGYKIAAIGTDKDLVEISQRYSRQILFLLYEYDGSGREAKPHIAT